MKLQPVMYDFPALKPSVGQTGHIRLINRYDDGYLPNLRILPDLSKTAAPVVGTQNTRGCPEGDFGTTSDERHDQ